ncbi:MAG TPA: hypothetical protein VI028_11180 [Solirubrobacterales bacterium]
MQRAEDPTEVLLAGFLANCELGVRLCARLEATIAGADMPMDVARTEPWVKGSTGQPKPHPGFAVARGCDETALALYRELTRGLDEMIPELAKLLG